MNYLDDMQQGNNKDMPDIRVPVFIPDQNCCLLLQGSKLNTHVSNHNANGQEI
jgi:hypothetical protein